MGGTRRALALSVVLLAASAACTLERYEVGDGADAADDVSCPDGERACSGECVDPSRDPVHCGGCGVECGAHASCEDGACICGTGLSPCPAGCVRLDNDPLNCGACERACAEAETCRRGECGP